MPALISRQRCLQSVPHIVEDVRPIKRIPDATSDPRLNLPPTSPGNGFGNDLAPTTDRSLVTKRQATICLPAHDAETEPPSDSDRFTKAFSKGGQQSMNMISRGASGRSLATRDNIGTSCRHRNKIGVTVSGNNRMFSPPATIAVSRLIYRNDVRPQNTLWPRDLWGE